MAVFQYGNKPKNMELFLLRNVRGKFEKICEQML